MTTMNPSAAVAEGRKTEKAAVAETAQAAASMVGHLRDSAGDVCALTIGGQKSSGAHHQGTPPGF